MNILLWDFLFWFGFPDETSTCGTEGIDPPGAYHHLWCDSQIKTDSVSVSAMSPGGLRNIRTTQTSQVQPRGKARNRKTANGGSNDASTMRQWIPKTALLRDSKTPTNQKLPGLNATLSFYVFWCFMYSFYQWATSTKNTFSLNFHKYWYGSCHTGHIAGALTVEFIIQKLVCHMYNS